MMTQTKLLRLLEFDKIKTSLADCAATSLGRRMAEQCQPSTSLTDVLQRLQATDEAFKVDRLTGGLTFAGISDTLATLKRSLIGGVLAPLELFAVAQNIDAARYLRRSLGTFHEHHHVPLLAHLAQQIGERKELSVLIRGCVDEQGHVLDQIGRAHV